MSSDLSLVHLFRMSGRCLLADGATGGLVCLTESEYRRWQDELAVTGAAGIRARGLPQLTELAERGFFRTPAYPDGPLPGGGLHSLCLNVSHACDLACTYCFAAQGGYGDGEKRVMDRRTARLAVDLALSRCPPGRTLSVDFFGGEPLLAWDTVVETVAYGRERAALRGSRIEFTLTTNGVGVSPDRAVFLAREMSTLIVSLDGRPGVHNRMRPTARGAPSYGRALAGARMLAEALRSADGGGAQGGPGAGSCPDDAPAAAASTMPRGSGRLWVRGTFTRLNLDFWRDAVHLWDLGFDQVSLEPATGGSGARWGLMEADLPAVRASYVSLIAAARECGGRFYHFELCADRPACGVKRLLGCGAGVTYACVSPSGSVYPCHQFDGIDAFRLGSVERQGAGGEPELPDPRFAASHVGAKEACRQCWAQLYCGGGCHYRALVAGGDLRRPDPLSCDLVRLRLEAALAFAATSSGC